ncbi:MAG TPA: mannose-6-phosphate isomerase [Ruminococcaceae bacterium]|nr:mannose-6-phosphate isomerase [Oscillospiraceae bacterium]
MKKILPFKLKAPIKDYIWGGRNLIKHYNKITDKQKAAESWELSCHKDGQSIIDSGEYKGLPLSELISSCDSDLMGSKYKDNARLGMLIKLIDADDNLSVQVHPNDEYALKHENQLGKTEAWVVLSCKQGAYLYCGLNRTVSPEEFAKRIENGTFLEILNKVYVKPGDVIFIEAGTVHAICGGIVIAEIQENSNVTYRIYDYDRTDKDGNKRELHIDKALQVCNMNKFEQIVRNDEPERFYGGTKALLASCSYFTSYMYDINLGAEMHSSNETFSHLLCVDGNAKLMLNDFTMQFQKGDSIFVPAGLGKYKISGECKLICSE